MLKKELMNEFDKFNRYQVQLVFAFYTLIKIKGRVAIINKKAFLLRTLFFVSFLYSGANGLTRLYPQYSYETASIYMLTIGAMIASLVGAIRLKRKMELLFGLWLIAWGMTMVQYSSYQGTLLSCIRIAPLLGYCIWVLYRIARTELPTDVGSTAYDKRPKPEEVQSLAKYVGYRKLFNTSLLIAFLILLFSMFYFLFFLEAIPKDQRGHAMFSLIMTATLVIVPTFLVYSIYSYLTKKVHDFMIWIFVAIIMLWGIIPAIYGFGWTFAVIIGIPWGITVFYCGKMDQERWKVDQGKKIEGLD